MSTTKPPLTRRDFFKGAGGLIIGFSLADAAIAPAILDAAQRGGAAAAAAPVAPAIGPAATRLDSWLRIEKDGLVRVFTGKVDIGMGVQTALGQVVAEELDVPVQRVVFVMGDTDTTIDQGGVGGSNSISAGARPLRGAAAAARGVLVQMASQRLGVPVDQLEVRDGIVRSKTDPAKMISYGELASTAGVNETLRATGNGGNVTVEGAAKPKDVSAYKVVGTDVPRLDLPDKVFGKFQYINDVRVPNMLHGRVIRPAGVGAKFVRMDDTAARKIAGYLKTVVQADFVGVVCDNEWSAIQAAKALKVTWSVPAAAFPAQATLYDYMKAATPKISREGQKRGDTDAAMVSAAKNVSAAYHFPFQSHATMGPGCAIADVRPNGISTIWSGGQKPHALQRGYAELLKVTPEKVRIVWVEDAGSYGRPGFEDVGADAILLSQAMGKPVRVQWMRADQTSWGPKGPAALYELSAALDATGNVTAVDYTSRAFSGGEIHFQPQTAGNFIASQLIGIPNNAGFDEFASWGTEAPNYTFANLKSMAHIVPPLHANPSPLATTHLRDPGGPATTFAVESFIDELAVASNMDPLAFRLKYLSDAKSIAVLNAVAKRAGWQPRSPSNRPAVRGDIATGRGIALGIRNGTYLGTIAEVEVNKRTGAVRVTKFVCSHDCGLVINPDGLKSTIASNLIQSMSRALMEEVQFDKSNVTSVDWLTYPIAKASQIPPVIDIEILNHPEAPSTGAGEPSSRATAAAIANAIFDATGARVRQVPFVPKTVLAAMA